MRSLYKQLPNGNYLKHDPAAGTYGIVRAEDAPRLVRAAARLSHGGPAAPPRRRRKLSRRAMHNVVVAAMLDAQHAAHAAGDPKAAVETHHALCDLLDRPRELRRILSGRRRVRLGWVQDGVTARGTPRWRGNAEHEGQVRYQKAEPGSRARRAAEVQASSDVARQAWLRHARFEATPEDYRTLADHLPALPVARLRVGRLLLGARWNGARRREEMVRRLLEHVQGLHEQAANPPAPEPEAEPAPEPTRYTPEQLAAVPEATAEDAETHDHAGGMLHGTREGAAAAALRAHPGGKVQRVGRNRWAAVRPAEGAEKPAAPPPESAPAAAEPAGAPAGRVPASDAEFVAAVRAAADHPDTAGIGPTKPYIASVADAVRVEFPGLSEDEFKARLVAAGRRGDVTLSRSDLIHMADPELVARSQTGEGTGAFHHVLSPAAPEGRKVKINEAGFSGGGRPQGAAPGDPAAARAKLDAARGTADPEAARKLVEEAVAGLTAPQLDDLAYEANGRKPVFGGRGPQIAALVKHVAGGPPAAPAAPAPAPPPVAADSPLADRLKAATAYLDPAHVKEIESLRQARYDQLTAAASGARDALDAAKTRLRQAGSRQPEKKNAQKEVNQLEKLADQRESERNAFLRDQIHETTLLQAAAVNPAQPDFVRYAAAVRAKALTEGKEYPGDEVYDHILDAVRTHLEKTGADPELAGEVAAVVSQNPERGVARLPKIIEEETTRGQMRKERTAAAAHIDTLDLDPQQKERAKQEAGGLYAGMLDTFKERWTNTARDTRFEREKRAEANKIAAERAAKEKAARDAATVYVAAARSGQPLPDAPPDALREVAGTVLGSATKWHAGADLPKGGSVKQLVADVKRQFPAGFGRFSFLKTIAEHGFITDTKYALKAPPELVELAKTEGFDKMDGRSPPIKDMIERSEKGTEPGKVVATREDAEANPRVLVESESGRQAEMDAQYVAHILKFYPKAVAHLPEKDGGVVLFKVGNETVGLVMPLTDGADTRKAEPVDPGARPALADVFAPGPVEADQVEESGAGNLRAGRGDNAATLNVKGDDRSGYYLDGFDARRYATYAQAVKAGKELLSYAHGTDDEGNPVFRPKGAAADAAADPDKPRRDFYAALKDRVKAHKFASAGKKTFTGADDKEVERDVFPVTDHFAVIKNLPDRKGKDPGGWAVIHTPTGMTMPTAWTNRQNAAAHAMLLQNIPGAGWDTLTADTKTAEPDRIKELGRRVKAVTDAFDNEELHPDLAPPPKAAEPPKAGLPKADAPQPEPAAETPAARPFSVGDQLAYSGRGAQPGETAEFRGFHTSPETGEKMARVIFRSPGSPPFETSVKPSDLSHPADADAPAPLRDRLAAAAGRAKNAHLPAAEVSALVAEAEKLSAADAVEMARKVAGVGVRSKADAVREIRAALTEAERRDTSQRV